MAYLFFDHGGQSLPYRLRGIGVGHPQEALRRPHGYPYHQWIQVRSGRLRVEVDGSLARARAGDGFYLRPREYHTYAAEGREGAVVDWLCFDGPGVESALAGSPLARSGIYRIADALPITRAFEDAWASASQAGATAPQLSARVYEILMALTEAASGPGRASVASGCHRLGPILRALDAKPARPWDVADMAALIGVSAQHMGRLFRRSLGLAPLEYLIRLRLNRALQLLLDRPDLRIHEVGEAVGYPDPNYFIRVFKDREGSTPGQFRELHGE